MNLPNKLTLLRIIFIPFFVFALLFRSLPFGSLIALILFLLASITDYFDGKIARKNNIETDFGKFADPLADKILVLSAFICFVELDVVPAFMVIILLSRDLIVTSLRLIASTNGKVIAANIFGKIKTVCQMITVIFILFTLTIKDFGGQGYIVALDICSQILLWISVLTSLISGIVYLYQNRHILKEK